MGSIAEFRLLVGSGRKLTDRYWPKQTFIALIGNDWVWVESCQSSARDRHSANARQIYNSENRAGSGIADKVNALAVPVVVEMSPLQGI